jgi:hypothetical protein
MNTSSPEFGGEHRANPVPPKTHRLVANADVAFVQQILGLAQRQRLPDIHHYCAADYLT